jgi:hypothetical protein
MTSRPYSRVCQKGEKNMGILDFLTRLREILGKPCPDHIRPCDELWEAVDLVVKLSHPNIHYVPHYQTKLMPAVEHTLKYADELIRRMPDPVLIEEDSWNRNPFIRTVFPDGEQFIQFFTGSPVLKEFYQKTNASRCCALLVMNRLQKKIIGSEMEGEILHRDVVQTSVDFSDHQIVAPLISEEETRKELSLRALRLLAAHALKEILSLIEWKKEMETEKQILEVKLHIQEAGIHSRKSLLPDLSDKEETHEAASLLNQLDRKITEIKSEISEPEDYLEKVVDLLYHPEGYLRLEPVRMFVNDMNIIMENNHSGDADEIFFAELIAGTEFRKAAALVNCNRF